MSELKPMPEGGWWLLIKRDLYERPGRLGYTGIRDQAGLYTKVEAYRHAEHHGSDHVVRLEDAPEFRNAAFPDLVQAHLIKQREDRDAAIAMLSAEVERLKEELGHTRMCLNCGKTVDANEIKRGDELPECIGPEGLSACTFNLTPQEAWLHWRKVAQERREEVERLNNIASDLQSLCDKQALALGDERAEVERLRGERDAAITMLRQHHDWHLKAGELGVTDGDGGWIAIDLADAYSDSTICENTMKVLASSESAPEWKPMPRGGMEQGWWATSVLERRKRKAAEARVAVLEEALRRIANQAWDHDERGITYSVGYAFSRVQGIARSALSHTKEEA